MMPLHRLSLVSTACGALICAAPLWADQTITPTNTGTAQAGQFNEPESVAALADAMQDYLVETLGSREALWKKLTGRSPAPNQSLAINLDPSVIKLGKVVYDRNVKFKVNTIVQHVDNCNGANNNPQHISVSSTQSGTGSWSDFTSKTTSHSHSISVGSFSGDPDGNSSVSANYTFSKTNTAMHSQSTGSTQEFDETTTVDTFLRAGPGESVHYQWDLVTLVGNYAKYTAYATVDFTKPIQFVIKGTGYDQPYQGMDQKHYINALDNTPPAGSPYPEQDLSLGERVIMSPDGMYLFGREINQTTGAHQGNYATVSVTDSVVPSNVHRLFTPLADASKCGVNLNLRISRWGELQLLCDQLQVWSSGTNVSNKPCYYLTFVGSLGELICYRRNPNNLQDADQKAAILADPAWRSGTPLKTAPTAPSFNRPLSVAMKDLTGTSETSRTFAFHGTFNGKQKASGPNFCLMTYELYLDKKNQTCKVKGLKGVVNAQNRNDSTGGPAKQGVAVLPTSGFAQQYCPTTWKFLQPYTRAYGVAILE